MWIHIYHSHGSYGQTDWPIGILPMSLGSAALDHQGESHFLGMSLGTRIFRKDVFFCLYVFKLLSCWGCVWPCFCMPKFYFGRLTKKTPATIFSGCIVETRNQRTSGVVILVKCFCVFQLDLWMKTDLFFFGGSTLTGLILWGRTSSNIFGIWGPIWVERQIHMNHWGCPSLPNQ